MKDYLESKALQKFVGEYYLSARWPGDAYNFSMQFNKMLTEK